MTGKVSRSILPTIYKVVFRPRAKKRFDKLATSVQRQIAKKLDERWRHPRVVGDALTKMPDCYKIKLRTQGVRLVYKIQDGQLILLVLTVAGRDKDEAYILAAQELAKLDD